MPMSEQERREYREDLARIFTAVDSTRSATDHISGQLEVVRTELKEKVSESTLETKLLAHWERCTGIREATGIQHVGSSRQPATESPFETIDWKAVIRVVLYVTGIFGSALGGYLAS